MLTFHQSHWGIDQWVSYLRDKEIPVLQLGYDDMVHLVCDSAVCDATQEGANHAVAHAVMSAHIARSWAIYRADVSPDEVTLALSQAWELPLPIPEEDKQAVLAAVEQGQVSTLDDKPAG